MSVAIEVPQTPTARAAIYLASRDRPSRLVLLTLFLLPFSVYVASIGRWSLDGDEIYTYIDSAKPVAELLDYETKPLYYLICHVLLWLHPPVPLEFLLRLPAALFASLAAPAYYWMLWTPTRKTQALLTALLVLFNPWLFEVSQFARYYSLMFLSVTVAVLALYRWLLDRRARWLCMFATFGLIATLSHTPAGVVFPAGIIAVGATLWKEDSRRFTRFLRKYGLACLVTGLVGCGIAVIFLSNAFMFWYQSDKGQFGGYTIPQLGMSLLIFGGLSAWALAALPLAKAPRQWGSQDVFLTLMVALSVIPFLFLVPLGGGIASRYLMSSLPCMYVLAGRHWATIDRGLHSAGVRLGLAACVLVFNVPYLISTWNDGNHYDYRATARAIEKMSLEDPIIVASSHAMLEHYLGNEPPVHELGTFGDGIPRRTIESMIEKSLVEQRPLYIVSREDRFELNADDQQWLGERFALVRSIQSQRYDHRRYRMAIYEFRPATRFAPSLSIPQ